MIAVLLLAGAGLIAAREYLASRTRDAAFQQIITALDQQDYEKVLDGAGQFLSRPPLSAADSRESQVRRLYDEAVVRWVAEQPGDLPPAVLTRLDEYRRLTPDAKPKGGK